MSEVLDFAREALRVEADAILRAARRLDDDFEHALEILTLCRGKLVATGVGKSGMAARKLAATLTSTGSPCVFMHPSEAAHGDLGIVASGDAVLALSNSGESEELLAILPAILARGVPIIAIVGNRGSTLARKSVVVLDASIEREACPLNLAPTTSVVVAMALGDALAMALHRQRGFRPEDYALNHPGGQLGRRLTLHVRDVMPDVPGGYPRVRPIALLTEILSEITAKCMGAACVTDEGGALLGIITDHDVRRCFQRIGADAFSASAEEIMTACPAVVLGPDQLAVEAMEIMENRPRVITVAPVVDGSGECIGVVRIHDFVRAGL